MRALLLDHPPRTWDIWLPKAAAVLRRRHNAASGDSPSKIVLGYEPPLPGQWKVLQASRQNQTLARPSRENVIQNHRAYQAGYAQPGVPPPTRFQVGDRVLVRSKIRPKNPFDPTWLGPYPVTRIISDALYEISINDIPSSRHLDNLRKAPPGNTPETDRSSEEDPGEDSSSGSGSGEYDSDSSDYEPCPRQTIVVQAQINATEQEARRMSTAPTSAAPEIDNDISLSPEHRSDPGETITTYPDLSKSPSTSEPTVPDGILADAERNDTPRLLANSPRPTGQTTAPSAAERDKCDKEPSRR